jgi:hypothetical protein
MARSSDRRRLGGDGQGPAQRPPTKAALHLSASATAAVAQLRCPNHIACSAQAEVLVPASPDAQSSRRRRRRRPPSPARGNPSAAVREHRRGRPKSSQRRVTATPLRDGGLATALTRPSADHRIPCRGTRGRASMAISGPWLERTDRPTTATECGLTCGRARWTTGPPGRRSKEHVWQSVGLRSWQPPSCWRPSWPQQRRSPPTPAARTITSSGASRTGDAFAPTATATSRCCHARRRPKPALAILERCVD